MATIRQLILAARGGDLPSFSDLYAQKFGEGRRGEAAGAMQGYTQMDPDADWDGKTSGRRNRNNGGDGKGVDGVLGDAVGWVQKGISAGHETGLEMGEHEFVNMADMLDILIDKSGKLADPLEVVGNIFEAAANGLIENFTQQNLLLEQMNQRTGMLGELSREFRQEITDAYPAAIRVGIGFRELTESIVGLVEESGKFKLLNNETIEQMALASAFAEDMKEYAEMAINFERVSMGIYDMTEATNKAGKSAMAIGLNARRTVKDVNENLKYLNQYGFKNGVDGLTKMVQKSIEFRMNVEAATNFAEKVWSPENALDVVANLQVLGGAVGDLNDPLKLMYMATNNVEGLQDAIIDASKALVTYNTEQGRFEVTGANLRRAKEMAEELGMTMGELTTTAVASMERTTAASQLMSQGLNIDEEEKEFLINMSQMKGGRMVIEVPESLRDEINGATEMALGDMSDEFAQKLIARRDEMRDKTMEEINREQVSLVANIGRQVSYIAALMRTQAGDLGVDLARDLGFDPLAMQNQFANWIDKKIAPKIDSELWEGPIKGTKAYQNLENKQPLASKGAPETQTTATNKTTEAGMNTKHEVTMTLKSNDNINEGVKRSIYNDPWFQSTAKNSFLEMFQAK